ncbi:MAG: type II toxin-antitoxin system RelE/ParE family toxin [Leptospirales bacterium]
MDTVLFDKNARKTIQGFPKEIKLEFGRLLLSLQKGEKLTMPTSKPMDNVFRGMAEIRMKDESCNFRIFYYTRVLRKIIVFHAFKKKGQKTELKEIKTGQKRLKIILETTGEL